MIVSPSRQLVLLLAAFAAVAAPVAAGAPDPNVSEQPADDASIPISTVTLGGEILHSVNAIEELNRKLRSLTRIDVSLGLRKDRLLDTSYADATRRDSLSRLRALESRYTQSQPAPPDSPDSNSKTRRDDVLSRPLAHAAPSPPSEPSTSVALPNVPGTVTPPPPSVVDDRSGLSSSAAALARSLNDLSDAMERAESAATEQIQQLSAAVESAPLEDFRVGLQFRDARIPGILAPTPAVTYDEPPFEAVPAVDSQQFPKCTALLEAIRRTAPRAPLPALARIPGCEG